MTVRHRIPILVLLASLTFPAWTQPGPFETNLDPEAARREAENTRGIDYPALSPDQALANALQRCASLPPFYRVDCEARVRGQVQGSGSVLGGGLLKETVTILPQDELEQQLKESAPR